MQAWPCRTLQEKFCLIKSGQMAPPSFSNEVVFLFYGCGMETPRSQEQASGSNVVGSKNPDRRSMCSPGRRVIVANQLDLLCSPMEGIVLRGRVLPGGAVTMHQETTVPGGLVACCKDAGMSLLGDSDVCTV